MAARGLVPVGVIRSTMPPENGELLDDQAESRGVIPTAKPRTRRLRTEKGHARNLVIPDSLYDRLCLYAQRTRVKVEIKAAPGKKPIERSRSLTVSEAACAVLDRGLPKLRIVEDE